MKGLPKISVITVSYNAALTIERTVLSVIGQSYSNFEYIIEDGASTDGTIEIISKYKNHIKMYSEPDFGIYDAMNRAKARASGDFVIFLGADDILIDDNVLSRVVDSMGSGYDSNSVFYGNVLLSGNHKVYGGEFSKWDWSYRNICHQCIFYPKSVYSVYDYDRQYSLVADWVYNLKLLTLKRKFTYMDIVISLYDNISGASSKSNDELFLACRKKLTIDAVGLIPYMYGMVRKVICRMSSYALHFKHF